MIFFDGSSQIIGLRADLATLLELALESTKCMIDS
jgi:hypothetical protein